MRYRYRYRPPLKPPPGAAHINWAHPLAHRLVAYFAFNEGAGLPMNLVQRQPGSFPDGPGVWKVGRQGLGLDFAGSFGDDFAFTLSGTASTANVTMASHFILDSLDLWRPILVTKATTSAWSGLTTSGAGGNAFTFAWDNAGNEYNASTGLVPSLGVPYVGVAALTGDGVTVYLAGPDGLATYSDANTNTAQTMDGLWRIGRDTANIMYLDGLVSVTAIWQRTLSPSEVRDYIRDPFALLTPIGSRVRWNLAAAGGFQPAWAARSNVVLSGGRLA